MTRPVNGGEDAGLEAFGGRQMRGFRVSGRKRLSAAPAGALRKACVPVRGDPPARVAGQASGTWTAKRSQRSTNRPGSSACGACVVRAPWPACFAGGGARTGLIRHQSLFKSRTWACPSPSANPGTPLPGTAPLRPACPPGSTTAAGTLHRCCKGIVPCSSLSVDMVPGHCRTSSREGGRRRRRPSCRPLVFRPARCRAAKRRVSRDSGPRVWRGCCYTCRR